MTPKPDHGEKTYKGCGKLEGRAAIITGDDSGIGRAVVIAFAREGADVLISYLPEEEDDARETCGRRPTPLLAEKFWKPWMIGFPNPARDCVD